MDNLIVAPKILVAPLDWGLGHATRCIPIIQALIEKKCEVIIAADGKVKALLEKEFPLLRFITLPGYKIEYARRTHYFILKIVAQIPKIVHAIKAENKWLNKIVNEEQIDGIISDNRYGLHHPKLVSVFITHQLQIKASFTGFEKIIQAINYRYINQFTACWVPDAEGPNNLAGRLSHPQKKPFIPLFYVGTLSRIKQSKLQEERHLLILLSGPEPQRSLLEKKVLEQLKDYTKPVVLVRGLPGNGQTLLTNSNIVVFNHLTAEALTKNMNQASFVISRCGYSTVMDLAAIKKKSILIPTPAQTEQEYLAKHLMAKYFAVCIKEKKFYLEKALMDAASFNYKFETSVESNLEPAIEFLLNTIQKKQLIPIVHS